MTIDWINILATAIVFSIVTTIIVSAASFFADRVREARRPKSDERSAA